jgi:ATP/maltotriose-dependent transcriptional regulator MalT
MRGIANSLFRLAEMLFITQGDQASIRSLLEEGLALFGAVGDKDGTAQSLCLSGRLALSQGDLATARSLAEECVALSREKEDWWAIAWSLYLLAQVEACQGDHAAARALYEESLAIAKKWNYKLHIASYLEGLASVVVVQGEPAWAAQLWGAAKAVRDAMGAPLPPVERADYERSAATARSRLGEEAFSSAWTEGRTMTLEQVLAAQRPVTMPPPIPAEPSTAPPVPKAPTYPDELTAREVEVLRFVAQGLTDAQVAEKLVISPRTVNTHLTSIYAKIQVSSRSAATAYALAHHLV